MTSDRKRRIHDETHHVVCVCFLFKGVRRHWLQRLPPPTSLGSNRLRVLEQLGEVCSLLDPAGGSTASCQPLIHRLTAANNSSSSVQQLTEHKLVRAPVSTLASISQTWLQLTLFPKKSKSRKFWSLRKKRRFKFRWRQVIKKASF